MPTNAEKTFAHPPVTALQRGMLLGWPLCCVGLILKSTWMEQFINRILDTAGRECLVLVQAQLFLITISQTTARQWVVPTELPTNMTASISKSIRHKPDSTEIKIDAVECTPNSIESVRVLTEIGLNSIRPASSATDCNLHTIGCSQVSTRSNLPTPTNALGSNRGPIRA